jgi:Uma2 family endonuclease
MSAHNLTPATTEKIIRQLVDSPRLPLVTQQLQSILQAEQEKRQHFYDEISETQKAEFINGEIIVHSPVKFRHSNASDNLFALLKAYVHKHRLGYVGHEKILITLPRNDYEPDVCFFEQAKAQAFTPDQTKFPAPDLVVEILSDSTEAIDRGVKFEDYALQGVSEYWIIDPNQETVEQYLLKKDVYELAVKVKMGTIQSRSVSGFEIPVRAIFDPAEQFAALQAILR